MTYRLGFDIGGTGIKCGICDENGTLVSRADIKTASTSEQIIADIIAAGKRLCAAYPIVSVGVGSAGRVERETGKVLRADHLPFLNEPIGEKLEAAFGVPVYLENDANCALLGELHAGACRDRRNVLMMSIGTGIGGAILIDGRLYRGLHGRAGEVGHFVFDKNGPPCPCGLRGCFEMYGSASALVKATEEAIKAHPDSLLARVGEAGVSGRTPFAAKERGCPVAASVLAEYGRTLALGINSMAYVIQPDVIVLAGGLSRQGKNLLDLITPHLMQNVTVRTSELPGDAGLIGAAMQTE